MARVRPNGSKRWVDNASTATGAYQDGVQNPRRPWQAATSGAEDNYNKGVQDAISKKRFSAGVNKAGDSKWSSRAISKGKARYATGVQDAQGDYASGVAPYLQVIESVSLPPRYTRGDPRNLERVKSITTALRAKKVGG